ncbi:MAG: T9SS type A sorting domain-containing protein [Candidatus Kapaibacterium sp.]
MTNFVKILAILFLFFSISAQSQLVTHFKAKAAFDTAEEYMRVEQGFSEPKLQFIGTLKQTFQFGMLEIPIDFDIENGTATGWLFFFCDIQDIDKSSGVFIVKPIVGDFLTFPMPNFGMDSIEFELDENVFVGDFEWMDSDVMVSKLLEQSDFAHFYNENKPMDMTFVALFAGVNQSDDLLVEPYWAIRVSSGDEARACLVQAENGYVECGIESSVDTQNSQFISDIYPNPAYDELTIAIDSEYDFQQEAVIYDIFGVIVRRIQLNVGNNHININDLTAGFYTVRVNNNIYKLIKKK